MFRALFLLAIMLPLPVFASCEESQNPSRECWNPPEDQVEPGLDRFYSIDEELEDALFRNDKKAVVRLANEYLSLAEVYKKNWNYGNAIHGANIALGTVALRDGDLKKASTYLLEAGKTPGSPQLDSFGPKLDLANALLQEGKTDAVVQYLKLTTVFWESHRSDVLAVIERISSGERLRLDRFRLMHAGG